MNTDSLGPPWASSAAAHCDGEVCITCSDQAVAVRVVRLLADRMALVDTGTSLEQISVALVEAAPGDQVLVHAKEAISRVEESHDYDI
ncbi:HypC/HybG/HupF family hydrogenase formation chaperone [Salinactinospora qingdaonensis]|uniref:Hydrogenase expression/formation protein HypC n=1 Tax=Salinactinospora qingdaonensis TaxID=702744 RepID=A0ABP7FDZ3_9ACTN